MLPKITALHSQMEDGVTQSVISGGKGRTSLLSVCCTFFSIFEVCVNAILRSYGDVMISHLERAFSPAQL